MNKAKQRRERKHQAELDRRVERGYAFGKKRARRAIVVPPDVERELRGEASGDR